MIVLLFISLKVMLLCDMYVTIFVEYCGVTVCVALVLSLISKNVKSVKNVSVGDKICVRVDDGSFLSEVTEI